MTARQTLGAILLLLIAWCLINNNHIMSNLGLKIDNDSESPTIADKEDYYKLASLPGEVPGCVTQPHATRAKSTATNESDSIADGCYHVFLDVGANMGVHGRFLFEPEKFPNATRSGEIFNRHFGKSRDNRDLCIFAFEPNPLHKAKLEENSMAYSKMGWRYEVLNVGVGTEDGVLSFYTRQRANSNQNDFMFRPEKSGNWKPHNVSVIHFAPWLFQHIYQRKIPDSSTVTSKMKPKIVMKMDIEHMEFTVLPDLITSGALCPLEFVFIEIHAYNKQEKQFAGVMKNFLKSSFINKKNCPVQIQQVDDETYPMDVSLYQCHHKEHTVQSSRKHKIIVNNSITNSSSSIQ